MIRKLMILAFGILLAAGASAEQSTAEESVEEGEVGPCYKWTEPVSFKADKFQPERKAGVQYDFRIGVVFYDNQKDVTIRLIHQWLKIGIEVTPELVLQATSVVGFTYWEPVEGNSKTMRCVVVLPKPNTVDGNEMCTWGHELAHCVLGQHYHMERIIYGTNNK